jgi:hypothetical protein
LIPVPPHSGQVSEEATVVGQLRVVVTLPLPPQVEHVESGSEGFVPLPPQALQVVVSLIEPLPPQSGQVICT